MITQAARRLRTDDSGMTVVEIVVAAFILFFVLTAILGLVAATTQASISAKERTAMTNAISSYVEYVRSLPFNRVALSSVDPSGGVDPYVVKTDGIFTITLTNSLTNGPHNTRELSISAVCTAPNFPSMHTTVFVAIRDKAQSMNDLGQPFGGGPIINFDVLTPAENTIVYASSVSGGGALYVDASAQSTSGVVYTMEFRVGDQRLKDGTSPGSAEAYWTPGTSTTYKSIRWDTRQVKGDPPVAAVMDGWRVVRILATDDLGRQTFKDRRFFVDNYAPSNPGTITPSPRTDVTTLITWPKSMDGSDPAYRYEMPTWKEEGYSGWQFFTTYNLTQPAHTLPTTAFSRYWVKVRALSPRDLSSDYVNVSYPFVSRPLLSGVSTCTITGTGPRRTSTVDVTLTFSQPTFPATGVTYNLYRGTSPTALTLHKSAISPSTYSETMSHVIGNKGQTPPYYYELRVTFTPTGWPSYGSSPAEIVISDIAGPTQTTPGTSSLEQTW